MLRAFPPVFRLALLVCSLVTWGLVFSCSGASAASAGVLAWGANGTGELGTASTPVRKIVNLNGRCPAAWFRWQ